MPYLGNCMSRSTTFIVGSFFCSFNFSCFGLLVLTIPLIVGTSLLSLHLTRPLGLAGWHWRCLGVRHGCWGCTTSTTTTAASTVTTSSATLDCLPWLLLLLLRCICHCCSLRVPTVPLI